MRGWTRRRGVRSRYGTERPRDVGCDPPCSCLGTSRRNLARSSNRWPTPSGGPDSVLVHEPPGRYGGRGRRGGSRWRSRPRDHLGSGWPIPQRSVQALGVVVLAPALDDDLRLGQAVEDLAIERFVARLGVEAHAVAILPGTARLHVGSPGAIGGNPVSHCLRHELRADLI